METSGINMLEELELCEAIRHTEVDIRRWLSRGV